MNRTKWTLVPAILPEPAPVSHPVSLPKPYPGKNGFHCHPPYRCKLIRPTFAAAVIMIGFLFTFGCSRPDANPSINTQANSQNSTLEQERALQERAEREKAERAERERIKANIENVLAQDAKTSDGAQSVADVVERMRDIDTSGCPNDFRSAYLTHIHAWEGLAEVEKNVLAFKKESNSDSTFVEAAIRGFLGDPLGKAKEIQEAQTQLQRDFQDARTEVKQTFDHVEETAISYGATVPR